MISLYAELRNFIGETEPFTYYPNNWDQNSYQKILISFRVARTLIYKSDYDAGIMRSVYSAVPYPDSAWIAFPEDMKVSVINGLPAYSMVVVTGTDVPFYPNDYIDAFSGDVRTSPYWNRMIEYRDSLPYADPSLRVDHQMISYTDTNEYYQFYKPLLPSFSTGASSYDGSNFLYRQFFVKYSYFKKYSYEKCCFC